MARLTVLNFYSVLLIVLCLSLCCASLLHLFNPFFPLPHNINTVTAVLSLAKFVHHSEVFPGVDLQQCNLRAPIGQLNLWAPPIISRSSFIFFMRLCSGRHVFMMFIVISTGSSAGISSDFADLVSKVLPTYRRISKPTSAVLEYCQLTGVSLNLPLSFMEIDSKRSTGLTPSRAIRLVRSLLKAKELEIVFKTIIEALLKKLTVFIFDVNCRTYPLTGLYFYYASNCFYYLAKSLQLSCSFLL